MWIYSKTLLILILLFPLYSLADVGDYEYIEMNLFDGHLDATWSVTPGLTTHFLLRDGTTPLTGDWNAGAFNITAKDLFLTDFSGGNESIDEILDDTINNGVLDAITVTDAGSLNVSWTTGEIWDHTNKLVVETDAGSGSVTNNDITFLVWSSGTTLTLQTAAPTSAEVQVAHINAQDGDIIDSPHEESILSTRSFNVHEGMSNIFPVITTNGLLVEEDVDVTNALDVQNTAGTFWHDGHEEHAVAQIKSRTVAMQRHFHTASAWDSDTNAEIDTGQYDNGTNLANIPNNQWVKTLFIISESKIHWVYANETFALVSAAIAANLPAIPPGLGDMAVSTALVYRQGDATLPTAGGDQWIDVRDTITASPAGTVSDHGNLTGLTDTTDHAYALLIDGTRDLTGDWIIATNNITLTAGTLTAEQLTSTDDLSVTDTGTFGDISASGNIVSTGGNIQAQAGAIAAANFDLTSAVSYSAGAFAFTKTGGASDGDDNFDGVLIAVEFDDNDAAANRLSGFTVTSTVNVSSGTAVDDAYGGKITLDCPGDPVSLGRVLHLIGETNVDNCLYTEGAPSLFGADTVGNTTDGHKVIVNRVAAEGTDNLALWISQFRQARIFTDRPIILSSGSGDINIGAGNTDVVGIGLSGGTNVNNLRQFGMVNSTRRYANFLLDETDDKYELSRSHTDILGFSIQMPLFVDDVLIYTPSATANITAAGGITVTNTIMRIQGDGGAIDITATPQIADGTDGQIVHIQGDSDVNTLTLDDGTGLQLAGAVSFVLGQGDRIVFSYDAGDDLWGEHSRSDN